MLIVGVHRINHGSFDAGICGQIISKCGLLVGTTSQFGSGVYAYYADKIRVDFRGDPMVVFQVKHLRCEILLRDIHIVKPLVGSDSRFFVLPAPQGNIVPISILGFANCPGFPAYSGTLAYI